MRRVIGTLPQGDTRFQTSQKPIEQPKESSWIVENLPFLGGIGGSVAGSVVPGLGTTIGAGVGAATGEAVKRRIKKNGVLGSIIPSYEGSMEDVKPSLIEGGTAMAGSFVGNKVAQGLGALGRGLGLSGQRFKDKLAATAVKATPSAYEKAAAVKLNINKLAQKWIPKLGDNVDDVLGKVERGAAPGTLQSRIAAEEKIISDTIKLSSNKKIAGDDLLKSLNKEARIILKELSGDDARKQAIRNVVANAKKLYKNGLGLNSALTKLRAANDKFGKNVFAEAGDSVGTASQKLEADFLRDALRVMFPNIAGALDNQQELIILREGLKQGRGKFEARGITASIRELLQEAIDPLAWKAVARGGKEVAEETVPPALANVPELKGLLTKQTLGQGAAQVGQESFLPTENPEQSEVPTGLESVIAPSELEQKKGRITPESVTRAYALFGKEKGDLLKKMYDAQNMGLEDKRTESQIARESAVDMARELLSDIKDKNVRTGPGAIVEDWKAKINLGKQETVEFNKKISALKATIAKARSGTSFTPNEEKLLDAYTPNVGDSYQNIFTALKILSVIPKKR